jgi:hypothetical protein
MKPQPMFSASVKTLLHSNTYNWAFCGSRVHEEFKSGGHLELQQRKMAPLYWYQIMGYKGPIFEA